MNHPQPLSPRFVRFMTDVARQVANADQPPRWNAGDFFGETFGSPETQHKAELKAPRP